MGKGYVVTVFDSKIDSKKGRAFQIISMAQRTAAAAARAAVFSIEKDY